MKKYFVIGHKRRLQAQDVCLCIIEAEDTSMAMEKATNHYGSLLYSLNKCIECGSAEAKAWFDGR